MSNETCSDCGGPLTPHPDDDPWCQACAMMDMLDRDMWTGLPPELSGVPVVVHPALDQPIPRPSERDAKAIDEPTPHDAPDLYQPIDSEALRRRQRHFDGDHDGGDPTRTREMHTIDDLAQFAGALPEDTTEILRAINQLVSDIDTTGRLFGGGAVLIGATPREEYGTPLTKRSLDYLRGEYGTTLTDRLLDYLRQPPTDDDETE